MNVADAPEKVSPVATRLKRAEAVVLVSVIVLVPRFIVLVTDVFEVNCAVVILKLFELNVPFVIVRSPAPLDAIKVSSKEYVPPGEVIIGDTGHTTPAVVIVCVPLPATVKLVGPVTVMLGLKVMSP
jgi:hypothetical protein